MKLRKIFLSKLSCTVTVCVLILFSTFFLAMGIPATLRQHHRFKSYQPVEATILSTWVESNAVGTHIVYSPRAEYKYEVNGQTYKSNRLPVVEAKSGTKAWAQNMIRRYTKGQNITAYYNATNPSDAFIIKQYNFFETYFFVHVAIALLAAAIGVAALAYYEFREIVSPIAKESVWFEIIPEMRIRDKLLTSILISALWHGVGIVTSGHYFLVSDPSYTFGAKIATGIYEAIGLVPFCFPIYYSVIMRKVGEARIFVNRDVFFLGDEIIIRLEQKVAPGAVVREWSMAFVCEEYLWVYDDGKDEQTMKRCYEEKIPLLNDGQPVPRAALEFEWTLILPREQNPSPRKRTEVYTGVPCYNWYIEVTTHVSGSPKYKAKFPIRVEARQNA